MANGIASIPKTLGGKATQSSIITSQDVPLIEMRHVTKAFSSSSGGPPVTILDGVNLEIREGEMLALLGQSGSGKSTILRLLTGLAQPTSGQIYY